MNRTLWKMPVPATGLIRGPDFKELAGRKCEIAFSIEAEDGSEKWLSLGFEGVEVFKATYLTSLGSVDPELQRQAYGAIISVEESSWLAGVKKSYLGYCATARLTPKELQHLMICFDDGPCYEFICVSFSLVPKP
ncbi:hypothetical protein SBV1_1780003 [Verrucomicrobia bacterium]|jgi:hypothetical protein|nr:hypothetical protein SBV1_1780003 [Verrucomicrobiota bacterium]